MIVGVADIGMNAMRVLIEDREIVSTVRLSHSIGSGS
jgi:hypothetical protein